MERRAKRATIRRGISESFAKGEMLEVCLLIIKDCSSGVQKIGGPGEQLRIGSCERTVESLAT